MVLTHQAVLPIAFSLSGVVNVKPHIITSSEVIFNYIFLKIIFVKLNLYELVLNNILVLGAIVNLTILWSLHPEKRHMPPIQQSRRLPALRMSPVTLESFSQAVIRSSLAHITRKPSHSLLLFSIEAKCTVSITTFWPWCMEMTHNEWTFHMAESPYLQQWC